VGVTVSNEIGVGIALRDGECLRLRQCNGLLDCCNSSESGDVFPEVVNCDVPVSWPSNCDLRHDDESIAVGLRARAADRIRSERKWLVDVSRTELVLRVWAYL
jgi:hypothetical protein